MKLSQREGILLLATLSVALFGGSALLVRGRLDAWGEQQRRQAELRAEIAEDKALVEERERWEAEFADLRGLLTRHAPDKKMDIYWLSLMDATAARHGIEINRRQAGEEARNGEVYELPIEVKEWAGTLEALVHFLFDLQEQGGMLDIRELYIKPRADGELRGRFVLQCAYTRERD
ncbi:MAG: hypothetical protein JW951_05165, partial [Lentisphaerae bacterium]|nr:hypothetical protein [Lentisphaerota bacterium]